MTAEELLGADKATVLNPKTYDKFLKKFEKHQRIYGKTGLDREYTDALAFMETRYPQLLKRMRRRGDSFHIDPFHEGGKANAAFYDWDANELNITGPVKSTSDAIRKIAFGLGKYENEKGSVRGMLKTPQQSISDPVRLRHANIAEKSWNKFQNMRAEAGLPQQPRDTGLVIDTTAEKVMDPRAKALLSGERAVKTVFKMTGKMRPEDRQEFGKLVLKAIAETPMKDDAKLTYATRAINALQGAKPPATFEEAFKALHAANIPSIAQGAIKRSFAQELQRINPGITDIRYGSSLRPLFGSRYGKGQTPFAIVPEKGPFDK